MIKLNRYSSDFEEAYWKVVDKKLSKTVQKQILDSCVKFLPNDFFDHRNPEFKEIVLAPYPKLKEAKKNIKNYTKSTMDNECFDLSPLNKNPSKINDLYVQMYNAFGKVAEAQRNKTTIRVRIVREADVTVCPYCNRDYINCRADDVSGAQLDHFFSRAEYPIRAVIPACICWHSHEDC